MVASILIIGYKALADILAIFLEETYTIVLVIGQISYSAVVNNPRGILMRDANLITGPGKFHAL
ncbi:hypothetical protein D3C77_682410 [compost metagenome]